MKYLAIDGDHIGAQLEKYLMKNDEKSISRFSKRLTCFIKNVAEVLEKDGYTIIYVGGDSILAKAPSVDMDQIVEALTMDNVTFSCGVGTCCRSAYIALKYAKVSGRSRFVRYENSEFVSVVVG